MLVRVGRLGLWRLVDPALDHDQTRVVAERILASSAAGAWPDSEPLDIADRRVANFLTMHRLWTMVPLAAVREDQQDQLRKRHVSLAAAHMRLRSVAVDTLSLLDDAGIETRVLKGLATSELDYPDRRLRHTGDVDLAVRSEQLDAAVACLRASGYHDHPNEFAEQLLYGWTVASPEGVEIDIHTRLFRRSPFGNHLFDQPGDPLHLLPGCGLTPAQRLVHAAGHFIISPPGTRRMSGLVDVACIVQRDDIDLRAARRFAAELGVESLVGAGIAVEAELSDRGHVLAQLRQWKQPDWLERSTRLVPERRLLLDHLGRYREVPAGQRLRYLPSWLLPDRRQWSLLRDAVAGRVGLGNRSRR